MDDIPFDGIITLFVFLIGVPALVFQLMDPAIRRVVLKRRNFWIETPIYVVIAISIVAGAIALEVRFLNQNNKSNADWVWSIMFLLLFAVTAVVAIRVPYYYGRRENIVCTLKKDAIKYMYRSGHIPDDGLTDLIDLAKQSDAGKDREVILLAFNDIVVNVCTHSNYRGDALETLINELVNILTAEPDPEDLRNFRAAAGIMTNIITLDGGVPAMNLKDRQHAVRALSALEQTMLNNFTLSLGVDYILLDYVQALGLTSDRFSEMATDVSQALFEIGSVALEKKQTLIAVSALEKMLNLDIGECAHSRLDEFNADLLGLGAHFWTGGAMYKEFVRGRINEIVDMIKGPLLEKMDIASEHCQKTMQFDTAEKLSRMAKELRLEADQMNMTKQKSSKKTVK